MLVLPGTRVDTCCVVAAVDTCSFVAVGPMTCLAACRIDSCTACLAVISAAFTGTGVCGVGSLVPRCLQTSGGGVWWLLTDGEHFCLLLSSSW